MKGKIASALLILMVLTFSSFVLVTNSLISQLGYHQIAIAFLGDNGSQGQNQSENLINDTVGFVPIPANATNDPSYLKVTISVDNTGGGTAKPTDFRIEIQKPYMLGVNIQAMNEAHPSSYFGSITGTISTIISGKYTILVSDLINDVPYSLKFSGDCKSSGLDTAEIIVKGGVKLTCAVSATYANF